MKEIIKFDLKNSFVLMLISCFLMGGSAINILLASSYRPLVYAIVMFILSSILFKMMINIWLKLVSRNYKRISEEKKNFRES